MKTKRLLLEWCLPLLPVILAGCASSGPEELWSSKSPIAHGALYRQAETVVFSVDSEKAPDCTKRSVVKAELFKAPEYVADARGRADVSFSGSGVPDSYAVPIDRRYSEFIEKWTINRCGSNIDYMVTFTPDHGFEGGTTVKAELAP